MQAHLTVLAFELLYGAMGITGVSTVKRGNIDQLGNIDLVISLKKTFIVGSKKKRFL